MALVVFVVEYGARCEDKPFTKWKEEHNVNQEQFKKTKTRRRNVGKWQQLSATDWIHVCNIIAS